MNMVLKTDFREMQRHLKETPAQLLTKLGLSISGTLALGDPKELLCPMALKCYRYLAH